MNTYEVNIEYTNPAVVKADYYDIGNERVLNFFRDSSGTWVNPKKVASFNTWLYVTLLEENAE